MRSARFAFVTVATGLVALVACGGGAPPAQAPAVLGAAPGPTVAVAPPHLGDAGPTSTTTQSLTAQAGGTKLTPLANAAARADGDDKHQGELGRTVADLRAIINSHRDEARACYDNALAAHPGIEGTIDIRWVIDPTGAVTLAEIDTSHSEVVEPAVANCIVALIKKIRFNASPKGFETKAHYPFNFHPHKKASVMGDGNPQ